MSKQEVEALITGALEGAAVVATDLTGTQDHWSIEIRWEGFADMATFQRHRRVMDVLAPHLEGTGTGAIHAVELKPRTPSDA